MATQTDIDKATKRAAGLATSAKIVAASAAAVSEIPAAPWTQLAGAIIGLVAAGLSIGAKLSARGTKALAGDETAVAGFAKRAARWSSAKRARVAKRLAAHIKPALARMARHPPKNKHRRIPLQKEIAFLKLKIAVLYGIEANARAKSGKPVIAGENDTIPSNVERDPASNVDSPDDMTAGSSTFGGVPVTYWIAGVAALAIGGILLSRSGRDSPRI